MSATNNDELLYLLRKAAAAYGADLVFSHPWLWEVSRWRELVLALLMRVTRLPGLELRTIVDEMGHLGLLDVRTLSATLNEDGTLDRGAPHARRLLSFLQDAGVDADQALRGLTVLAEAARSIEQHFDGKIQRYLRGYGEMMLRELDRYFHFSALSRAEAEDAFTFWLQNVLSLPLSLIDEHVRAFSEEHGVTPSQLIGAADELDMNLAYLDDVITCDFVQRNRSRTSETQPPASIDNPIQRIPQ